MIRTPVSLAILASSRPASRPASQLYAPPMPDNKNVHRHFCVRDITPSFGTESVNGRPAK